MAQRTITCCSFESVALLGWCNIKSTTLRAIEITLLLINFQMVFYISGLSFVFNLYKYVIVFLSTAFFYQKVQLLMTHHLKIRSLFPVVDLMPKAVTSYECH